jgi:hypothetical protein
MTFTAEQRNIFAYNDGCREVFGDPVAIDRRLTQALGCSPHLVLTDAKATLPGTTELNGPVAFPAIERLMAATRQAFEMAPFDKATGMGAREEDCLAALNAFCSYMQVKKKNTAPSRTSSAPSAATRSPSPTKPTSASTATSTDCGCSGP